MQMDLWMMMGQSNMAGRGITSSRWPDEAPALTEGAGWEYRAVSAPGALVPIREPFGAMENRAGGIDDGRMKTGSLVTAFVNAYFAHTHVPVAGVSASKGGSCIREWQPGTPYLSDAMDRMHAAERFLRQEGHTVRHRCLLWCQGETDADLGTPYEDYRRMFFRLLDAVKGEGVEKLMMIQIGKCNLPGAYERYDPMIRWQEEIAGESADVILVSKLFQGMRDQGLMKDAFHYYQRGYNLCGADAGERAAQAVTEMN